MKSVYVDDALHRKLKHLAQENQQTLLSLLNRLVREGIEHMEKKRLSVRVTGQDPIGMFGGGQKRKKKERVDVEEAFAESRYQGVGERDDGF